MTDKVISKAVNFGLSTGNVRNETNDAFDLQLQCNVGIHVLVDGQSDKCGA